MMISINHPSAGTAHVCIILHQLGHGGVDRVAAILANGFAARGIKTELLVCASGGPAEKTLKEIVGDKVKLRFFRDGSGHRTRDLIAAFRTMGRYLRVIKPDIILAAGNNVSLYSFLLKKIYCSPKTHLFVKTTNPVLRPHDSWHKRWFRRLCYMLTFRFCNGVLSLTDAETQALLKAFPCLVDKLLTVANPYINNRNTIQGVTCTGLPEKNTKLLLAVGRLQKQKRFDVLLKAFDKVRRKMDCRLVILGEGEDRLALEELARTLGITDLLQMPGFVTDVTSWYAISDLFVLSSDYEGLPAVVLEALWQNCPVVSTRCFHGVEELLKGAPGCELAPFSDPEALALAISRSIHSSDDTSTLYQLSKQYCFDAAVDNHINAIQLILHQQQSLVIS